MIAISFSVPSENSGMKRSKELDIWYLGIGSSIATAVLAEQLSKKRPQFLVISGFAGALHPHIQPGETFLCENVSDCHVIQNLLKKGWKPPSFAKLYTTQELAATAHEKSYLYRTTGMDLVDMETKSLFEVAQSYNIPAITIRAVSDSANTDFPVPESILYDRQHQRTRPLALCTYLTMNPKCIPKFISLLTSISQARMHLKRHLNATLRVMQEMNQE